jgi:hypothetical protein
MLRLSSLSLCAPLATEAQVFSLQEPSHFFSTYAPPRTDAAYKLARTRLEEDLRFAAKMVKIIRFYYWSNSPYPFPLPRLQTSASLSTNFPIYDTTCLQTIFHWGR